MSLTTLISKVQYTCNGTTDTYPYTFKILSSSDLYVINTDLLGEDTTWTENTEYTVTGVGEESGGNVVIDEAYLPTSGTLLTIYRNIPLTQETDYVENDPFHADTLETDFDRTIMIIQQLDEELNRCIRAPISDEGDSNLVIPSTTARLDKLLGFDENGDFEAVDRDLAYRITTANITDFESSVTSLTNDGSVEHSNLGGLDGDDHSQYHTDARGDARYYTQSQITTTSGDIVNQIPSLVGYATTTQLTTTSGDIVAQIPVLSSGSISKTMLKTATGSATGSLSPSFTAYIEMQDYCFFPQIHASVQCAIESLNDSPVDYVAQFSLYNSSSGTATYGIYYRYITSSDEPFIYAIRDKLSGDVLCCWISEDPPPAYWGASETPQDFVPPIQIVDADKKPIFDPVKHEALISWKVDKKVIDKIVHAKTGINHKPPHEVLKDDFDYDVKVKMWKQKEVPSLPKLKEK